MSRPSILHKTEAAIIAAFRTITTGPLAGCNFFEGQSVDIEGTVEPPAVTGLASDPVEITFDSGMFDLKFILKIETQIYQEPSTPADDPHHARVQAARDFMEDFDLLTQALATVTPCLAVSSVKLESPGEQQSQGDNLQVTEIPYCLEVS